MLELLVHRVEDGSHLTSLQRPKVVNASGEYSIRNGKSLPMLLPTVTGVA
jgi:hypothetical protein